MERDMAECKTSTEAPPTKLVLRTREGLLGFVGPPSQVRYEGELAVAVPAIELREDATLYAPGTSAFSFSKNGALMVCISEGCVEVRSTSDGERKCIVEAADVQAADVSPLGTFLLTWQRPIADSSQENLKVWSTHTATVVCAFRQKTLRKAMWPNVQWNADETLSIRLTPNELHLYHGHAMADGIKERIVLAGCTSISVAPQVTPLCVALFVPENKGRPARVSIFKYPNLEAPCASKSFYQADSVDLKWAPDGSAVLIHTHTELDKTGSSYYGSTSLYLLQADGGFDCIVPLSKEGLIHDVAWSPTAKHFVVVAGTMPAQTALYDTKCRQVFEFGQAHRNTLCWSPHGRFLCIAGFGNLAGEMDFWDMAKLRKLGSNAAHTAVEFGWSPDGRYFMTATCAPRMNMDNGVKVFKYNGVGPVIERAIEPLYEAKWVVAPASLYHDRPPSPRARGQEQAKTPAPAVVKPAAYRAPGSTGTLAAQLKAERDAVAGAHKVKPGGASGAPAKVVQRYIPGLAPVESKPESKNAAKKKKKLQQQQQQQQQQLEDAHTTAKQQVAEETKSAAATSSPALEPSAVDPSKRLKNLKKKLKQIEELRVKVAAGEELNEDQREKLTTEDSLRCELQDLEASM